MKNKISYKKVLEKIEKLRKYLRSIRVKFTPNNRIARAYNLLVHANSLLDKPSELEEWLNKVDKNGRFFFSHLELLQLSGILDFIRTQKPHIIKHKYKIIQRGPIVPLKETRHCNEPRNTVFELNLASRLYRVSFNVSLGNVNPDIYAHIDKRNYCIQCKRVMSENSISDRVEEAYFQLKKDLSSKNPSFNFGIIALSVERILTSGDKFLPAKTRKVAIYTMQKKLQDLIDKHKQSWLYIKNKNIVGLILEASCGAKIENEGNLPTLVTVNTLTNINAEYFNIFVRDFADNLEKLK